MKRLGALAVLACLFFGPSCADLPTLQAGQCGNGVVDPGEDCDGFPRDGCRPPGDAAECHFRCSACPSGWGCNTFADTCSEPTGRFESVPTATFEATASQLASADFDGDKRSDLLARSQADASGRESLRVFFFDGSGPPAKSLALGASAIGAQVHDVNGDGRNDLTFCAKEVGVNVLLGGADRNFAPVAFPRFPFPPGASARLVRVNGMELRWEVEVMRAMPIIFAELIPGNQMVALGIVAGDPGEYALAALDRPASKMLGEPIAANIVDGGADYACEELLWTWQGERTVQWLETCLPGNIPWLDRTIARKPKTLLTLPDGEIIRHVPIALDLNGDEHVDLLIEGTNATYVAFGVGNGSFSAKPDLTPTASPVAPIECRLRDPVSGAVGAGFACAGGPLAAYSPPKRATPLPSDQTLIAFPQFVLGLRKLDVAASGRVTLEGVPVVITDGAPWTTVLFDDLNSNGLIDIAAASSNASDVDFYNGTPTPLFNPGKIRTDSPVRTLTAGDFDGDLIHDLAFVEIGAGGGTVDAIGVAYGKFAGVPEPALRLGTFPNIVQAMTAKAAGYDGTLQLGIVYKGEADTDLIAILEGNGDRQLLSPFGFGAPLSDTTLVQGLPYVVVPGRFDDDALPDVLTIGFDEDNLPDPYGSKVRKVRPWLAKGRTGARLEQPILGDEITTFTIESRSRAVAVGRAGDLNGDGLDEAVILAPSTDGDTPMLSTVSLKDGKVKATPGRAITGLPKGQIGRLDLALADVDGDGKLDAVVGAHSFTGTAFVIAWGDGAGGFDVAGATPIHVPEATLRLRSFAPIQLDTDPASELVVASPEGTYAVQATGRTLHLSKLLGGADAVTAGDFNGDGLPDLALSREHRVGIYLGVSR